MCIKDKKSNLENVCYSSIAYTVNRIIDVVLGSLCAAVALSYDSLNENYRYMLSIIWRIIFICFLIRYKKIFAKLTQSWMISIVRVVAIIVLVIDQAMCIAYSMDNLSVGYVTLACLYMALLFTVLWLLDHRKMVKIQDVYAADNKQMSQKLHRSREILPMIANYVSNMDAGVDEDMRDKLEDICHDYGKELGGREMSAELFESTGVALVDLLLRTKMIECDKQDIELDVFVSTQMNGDLKRVDISEGELARMLGDLIRNAIHAVEPVYDKMILVMVARDEEKHLLLQIFDSGIPFPEEVLEHFGERGQTTWGTGNGLADMMETLGHAGASLDIRQNLPEKDVFTKQISICFDGKGKVQIEKLPE
jgi:hypothetical protein